MGSLSAQKPIIARRAGNMLLGQPPTLACESALNGMVTARTASSHRHARVFAQRFIVVDDPLTQKEEEQR